MGGKRLAMARYHAEPGMEGGILGEAQRDRDREQGGERQGRVGGPPRDTASVSRAGRLRRGGELLE